MTYLQKNPICKNDFLPISTRSIVLFSISLSLIIRTIGYFLATDKSVFLSSHDWIYHSFWLPLHLMLARYTSNIFGRYVSLSKPNISSHLISKFNKRVENIVSVRGMLIGLMLVTPFATLDFFTGFEYFDSNFASQGYAGVLIPLIWMLEWLATAVIWIYVIGVAYLTPVVLNKDNLFDRHFDILFFGKFREPVIAGLENGLVILIYGLSTIGYVWYADGQVSDYLVLFVSFILVLFCFFSGLLQLKRSLRENLNAKFQEVTNILSSGNGAIPCFKSNSESCETNFVSYKYLTESTDWIYGKSFSLPKSSDEQIRLLKLSVCIQSTDFNQQIPKPIADEFRLLFECEARLAQLGVGELKTLIFRLGLPIFAIVFKSLGGLLGLH